MTLCICWFTEWWTVRRFAFGDSPRCIFFCVRAPFIPKNCTFIRQGFGGFIDIGRRTPDVGNVTSRKSCYGNGDKGFCPKFLFIARGVDKAAWLCGFSVRLWLCSSQTHADISFDRRKQQFVDFRGVGLPSRQTPLVCPC